MAHPSTPPELTVSARAPFEVYYEGVAKVVSALNKVGQFDILPGHADFFSILKPGDVVIDGAEGPVTFAITNGIISVRDNQVMLFVNM
jgi:F-type H+-transporting ATPase subunit epsilon